MTSVVMARLPLWSLLASLWNKQNDVLMKVSGEWIDAVLKYGNLLELPKFTLNLEINEFINWQTFNTWTCAKIIFNHNL